jgi:Sec-independent protein translocase protein TatA
VFASLESPTLFGGKRIPELAKGLGKGVRELRKGIEKGAKSQDDK